MTIEKLNTSLEKIIKAFLYKKYRKQNIKEINENIFDVECFIINQQGRDLYNIFPYVFDRASKNVYKIQEGEGCWIEADIRVVKKKTINPYPFIDSRKLEKPLMFRRPSQIIRIHSSGLSGKRFIPITKQIYEWFIKTHLEAERNFLKNKSTT